MIKFQFAVLPMKAFNDARSIAKSCGVQSNSIQSKTQRPSHSKYLMASIEVDLLNCRLLLQFPCLFCFCTIFTVSSVQFSSAEVLVFYFTLTLLETSNRFSSASPLYTVCICWLVRWLVSESKNLHIMILLLPLQVHRGNILLRNLVDGTFFRIQALVVHLAIHPACFFFCSKNSVFELTTVYDEYIFR